MSSPTALNRPRALTQPAIPLVSRYKHDRGVIIALVGSQCDMTEMRKISFEEGQALAER